MFQSSLFHDQSNPPSMLVDLAKVPSCVRPPASSCFAASIDFSVSCTIAIMLQAYNFLILNSVSTHYLNFYPVYTTLPASKNHSNGYPKTRLTTATLKETLEPLNVIKPPEIIETENGKNGSQEIVQMTLDLKGETFSSLSLTIKSTAAGILATLSHCIDLVQRRDQDWKKLYETEKEKRKKLEEMVQGLQETSADEIKEIQVSKEPEYEEDRTSVINEEEFFDAVDAMLDRKDQQEEEKRQLKLRAKEIGEPSSSLPEICDHPLWHEINKTTLEQLKQARLEVGEGDGDGDPTGGWELFAAEGDMRLYKRDLVVDGLVCDPLKAVHTVRGITGHEVCYHFFSPDVRWDWENTLESMKVVEEINPNTLVFHQIHKRVWPAAQRDAVFWSHIRKLVPSQLSPSSSSSSSSLSTINSSNSSLATDKKDPDDIWIVCNNSTDRNNIPLGRCVRMKMTVSLTCETFIEPAAEGQPITRDNLVCKIIYCSTINPGGWAPASVLRALYKREYPKFLKNFTQYVIDARKEKPILF